MLRYFTFPVTPFRQNCSVVFHSPDLQRAFVGDVLFAGTVFVPGHGPESTFGEAADQPYVRGT